MFNPVLVTLRVLVFSALVFTALRLGYLVLYPDYFAPLGVLARAEALLHGLRFDLSITAMASGIFLLFFLWPWRLPAASFLGKAALWCIFALLTLLWWLNVGDMLYFGEVYRHTDREIMLLSEDYGLLFDVARHYLPALLALLTVTALLGWAWHKRVVTPAITTSNNRPLGKKLALSFCALLIIAVSVRGLVLSGKPINLIDAYALGNEHSAALALNGAFSIVRSARQANSNTKPLRLLAENELQAAHDMYQWDEKDPFIHHWARSGTMEKRNVVIILLESWGANYIDALSGTHYGATPFFDSLIGKSRVWTNAFAAGQRSIEGIQAVLTSVPVLPNHPVIGWGLEQNRMARLADVFGEHDYQSVMIQSSNRRSYHMDGIAAVAGFDEYFGQEDIPLLREYPEEAPRFGWDYETLMFLADRLEAEKQEAPDRPFVSFTFTGTTHEPFAYPGKEFQLYPHDRSGEKGYLNTLHYSDWALGQFMQRLSQHSWYKDTVFVFLADHVMRASYKSLEESFRIPLVIYTPDGFLPAGKEERFASQYDVLPTLVSLLNVPGEISAFGKSLVDAPQRPEGVLLKRGNAMLWLHPDGSLNLGEPDKGDAGIRELALRVKAEVQLADHRVSRNLWWHRDSRNHVSVDAPKQRLLGD